MITKRILLSLCVCLMTTTANAEQITVAAAADLKFALEELAIGFRAGNPGQQVDLVFGSSGKFFTQIQQGAPYDLFFSADINYPQELIKAGAAGSPVRRYALGRIVLWSNSLDASKLTLASLAEAKITRIAMANPKHAPYGKRAEEALRTAKLWEGVSNKMVFGENVGQAVQFVQTGNAQVGIIALSLAKSPELSRQGAYWLIPDNLHLPLEQGFIITKRAENSPLAKRFADYVSSKRSREIMMRYGFVLPGETN